MAADYEPLGGEPSNTGQFLLEVDGVEIGRFSQVAGLELEVVVEEYVEGGQNGYVHQLPGGMRWPHLTFSRGLVKSDALFEWVQKSSGEGFASNSNTLKRTTGAVTAVDRAGKRLRAWQLDGVFPVKWTGPTFNVDSEDGLSETLEVAHNGFRAKTP